METDIRFRAFAEKWQIADFDTLTRLYDIHDLEGFLPAYPTEDEKAVLNSLIGTEGADTYGYMDYVKNSHTFELIMQWQERTGNYDGRALFFTE
ncbi:MAG: hypothetical protein SF053_03605 [Bacteroidia bacterium]|nr:hypothetical protein [Bacteroidia bacterium]